MIPISRIQIGDVFRNPNIPNGVLFVVVDKEEKEKMILVQGYQNSSFKSIGDPFWKKNTDRMFNESWRC